MAYHQIFMQLKRQEVIQQSSVIREAIQDSSNRVSVKEKYRSS